MLKDHQELLEQIEKAEGMARKLYEKGPRIEDTVQVLRQAGNAIKSRIRAYKDDARKPEPKAPTPPPVISPADK